MNTEQSPDLSIVLPVFNEEGNVEPLHEEIHAALDQTGLNYEILFIDDGSSDRTVQILREIAAKDPVSKLIVLRRNFGQTAAMAAGLDMANGEVVVTMDADRQNDPADIPALLARLDEGYDMVCGWRHKRQDGFLLRLLPSMIANKIISYTTDVKLHDYGCTLKAIRKDVAKQIRLYGEMHRFIPAIASWIGVRIAEMKVNHRARVSGQSKYGISRTFRVILDLLTVKFLLGFAARPIQFFGSIGLTSSLIGLALCVWLGIQRLFMGVPLSDRPILLLAVMLVFIGLQFITVGLLAEMQTRTYYESQGKTTYSIREVID